LNLRLYFPELTELQHQQLEQLPELYTFWNEQINVISRKDIDLLMERHVLHSLGIAKVLTFKYGTTIVDVGTGGGFPGVPLAIMFPESEFHLIDSIGKKIKVVNEIVANLGLKNVKAEQLRAESLPAESYDFAVSRAVTRLAELKIWLKNKFAKSYQHELKNGLICLKGGDLTEEIAEAQLKTCKIVELRDFFEESFFETKKVVYATV
jgi:16S rRNA (guanine527-N7)-methyltransferase